MGHHLEGRDKFKSGKYHWCPEGFFAFKLTDRDAWQPLFCYADTTKDHALAQDLTKAVQAEIWEARIKCRDFHEVSQPDGIATSICWICGSPMCPRCEPEDPHRRLHTCCENGS